MNKNQNKVFNFTFTCLNETFFFNVCGFKLQPELSINTSFKIIFLKFLLFMSKVSA